MYDFHLINSHKVHLEAKKNKLHIHAPNMEL